MFICMFDRIIVFFTSSLKQEFVKNKKNENLSLKSIIEKIIFG
jgi:hypothetical protein